MVLFDTNVYIDLAEHPERTEGMARLVADSADTIGLSSVVVAELLIALDSVPGRKRLLSTVIDPIEAGCLVTPSHGDWETAARALHLLGGNAATKRRSFWNDLLIAASCARVGATLLTSNEKDFRRVRRAIRVETVAAWSAS